MAVTGTICSTFDILLQGDFRTAATGATFYAPRGFTLTGITVQNTAASAGTLTVSQVTTTDNVAAASVDMTAVAAGTTGAAAYFTNAAAPGNSQVCAVLQTSAAIIPKQTAAVPGTSTTGVYTKISVIDSVDQQLDTVILHCQGNNGQAVAVETLP